MTYADELERYRLDERIATGGMGEVWRATDTVLHRPVAVKLLKTELADDPEFRTRFETEARHAASLHHPGIASVFDFGGTTAHRPYLVMELVDGQPLSALLRRGKGMPPAQATALMSQVAVALGAAHAKGIVHRDVKPANLLVTPDRRVKITDFGIARAGGGVALTRTGQVMGTPQYLSPEQAEGKPATAASDVYSVGVVLYECLVGKRLFDADSPVATALAHVREPVPALPDDIPADLAAVVQRCLAKNPRDRFKDGAALAAALRDPSGVKAPAMPPVVPVAPTLGTPVGSASGPAPTAVLTGLPPAAADPGSDPDRRGGGGWLWLVALLLGALIVLVGWALWRAASQTDEPTDDPSTTPSASRTPTTEATVELPVSVCEGDVDDVVSSIRNRELQAFPSLQTNPGNETEGEVIDCDPVGTLREGQTVTVRYWGPAPEPTPSDTPTTATTAPTTAATTPTTAPTGGLLLPREADESTTKGNQE